MLGHATSRLDVRGHLAWPTVDQALVRQLLTVLVAATVLETALLRILTRIGVHLPKDEAFRGLFHTASTLGSLAMNFASILAIALVVMLLAFLTVRIGSVTGRLALGILSGAMLWGLGMSLATDAAFANGLFGLTMVLLVGLVGFVLPSRNGTPTVQLGALALIVVAYFCYQYYALGHLAYRLLDYTSVPPMSVAVLRAGEGLIVVAGFAAFLAWGAGRWRRVGWIGIGAVAIVLVILFAAALSPASTMPILALWTTGLSLFLPLPIYLLSLGLFLLTLIACWRSGAFWLVSGLSLLILAGYMPEATYHHLLLLLGVACIAGTFRWAVTPSTARD